jgi:hypothetical protein
MDPDVASNRALQLRAMDRLRQRLLACVDPVSGLPSLDGLTAEHTQELREMGGGCLGAIAIVAADASALEEVIRLVQAHVRRTDLLASQPDHTLLVLAPGLDPVGGQGLTARLEELLQDLPQPAAVGAAYRSPLSLKGWQASQLAAEARRLALASPEPVDQVA